VAKNKFKPKIDKNNTQRAIKKIKTIPKRVFCACAAENLHEPEKYHGFGPEICLIEGPSGCTASFRLYFDSIWAPGLVK